MKSILNIRPFQLILMAVFVLFALLGLYFFATFKGFGGGTQIGSVVIWGTLPQSAMTDELTSLSGTDKGYGKVSYVQKQAATFDSDLANAIASGQGPDLIIISQERLLTEKSRLQVIPFSAIPQRTYIDTYLPEASLFLTSNGTFGVPFVVDPLVLYYNKNLLSSVGAVTPPASWEAVMGLTGNTTRIAADGSIAQSTIALGTYSNIPNARDILSLLFLQAGNPITQTGSTRISSTLQDSGSIADGIQPSIAAVNFYTQFADPSRTVYSWNQSEPSALQAFTSGDTLLYVGYSSEQPTIAATNPNLSFDMAAIPQPLTAKTRVDYGRMYAFAIPKASGNASGALATAKALSSAAYLPVGSQALLMAPAVRSLLIPSATDTFSPIYYSMALISQGWLSPSPDVVDSLFSRMIGSIVSGQLQASEALSQASQALDASINGN